MLDGLIHAYQSGDQKGALLRAYHLALLVLAVPGVLLGLLYSLMKPAAHTTSIALALVGLSVVLAGAVLEKVRRSVSSVSSPGQPFPPPERLAAALQLGSAPGVPFLLGCAAFHDPLTWLGCWAVALAAYLLGRQRVLDISRK
ncbi:hypothetical protein ACFOPQ_13515 [Deinococcus antarcticus]|uniref:Uncharacterized protein n=1 Tax=Deinococcus antarcticus TaxID=1298767 RepID=A0ABV8A8T4_9DEIO